MALKQEKQKTFEITQPDPDTKLYQLDQERIRYFQENKNAINDRFNVALQELLEEMDISRYGSLETEEEIVQASLKATH